MKLQATFFETDLSEREGETLVVDAVNNVDATELLGAADPSSSGRGEERLVKIHLSIDYQGSETDEVLKEQLTEYITGRDEVDCRVRLQIAG